MNILSPSTELKVDINSITFQPKNQDLKQNCLDYLTYRKIRTDNTDLSFGYWINKNPKLSKSQYACLVATFESGAKNYIAIDKELGKRFVGGFKGYVWKHNSFNIDEPLFIVESVLCALSLIQSGFNAIATGTANNLPGEFYNTLPKETIIYLAYDNDDSAGHKSIKRDYKYLKDNGFNNIKAALSPIKDWNDVLTNNLFLNNETIKESLEIGEKYMITIFEEEQKKTLDTTLKTKPVTSVEQRARGKKYIEKQGKNRLISEVARDVCTELAKHDAVFRYGNSLVSITEVERKDKDNNITYFTGVRQLTASRFPSLMEKYIEPVKTTQSDTYASSFNESESRQIIESNEAYILPYLNSISQIKLPYIKDNVLNFTDYGYNKDTNIYTCNNSVDVNFIPLNEAKEFIKDLLSEFCFLEYDLGIAGTLAYLLTPMVKLLTNECKSQVFEISGNREGVGKDYLLGIPILIYENRMPFYYAPCNSDDEYKKVFFSACRENERFLLFSNMKGYLNSKAFEHYATSPTVKDRILGETTNAEYPNTSIIGITANGLAVTPDMVRRILEIRLEYYEEEVKKRVFKRELYPYILENREKILNILYSMIKNWFKNGMPLGNKIPSFERWSSVVSGILTSAGYKNPFDEPTKFTASMQISGDRETQEFRKLFELWYERHKEIAIKMRDIVNIAQENELFNYLDLDNKSGQIKLAKKISERDQRIYTDLKLIVLTEGKYNQYYLEKIKENIFLESLNMPNMPNMPTNNIESSGMSGMSGISEPQKKKFIDDETTVFDENDINSLTDEEYEELAREVNGE